MLYTPGRQQQQNNALDDFWGPVLLTVKHAQNAEGSSGPTKRVAGLPTSLSRCVCLTSTNPI